MNKKKKNKRKNKKGLFSDTRLGIMLGASGEKGDHLVKTIDKYQKRLRMAGRLIRVAEKALRKL